MYLISTNFVMSTERASGTKVHKGVFRSLWGAHLGMSIQPPALEINGKDELGSPRVIFRPWSKQSHNVQLDSATLYSKKIAPKGSPNGVLMMVSILIK